MSLTITCWWWNKKNLFLQPHYDGWALKYSRHFSTYQFILKKVDLQKKKQQQSVIWSNIKQQ